MFEWALIVILSLMCGVLVQNVIEQQQTRKEIKEIQRLIKVHFDTALANRIGKLISSGKSSFPFDRV